MAHTREVVFIDPFVADLDTILGALRPEVEAVVLDDARPAARQIAAALAGRHGLSTVHVMAHGAPGRVSFAAGDWSAATLDEEPADFAAIGRALADDGDLRLWSCDTGAGVEGAAFLDRLAQATGAEVAAATGRVGAAALGGVWELATRTGAAGAHAPLTEAGIAQYAGVLAANNWQGPGGTALFPQSGNWGLGSNWSSGSAPISTDAIILGGSGTYTVTLDVSSYIAALSITDTSATLNMGSNVISVSPVGGFNINNINNIGSSIINNSGTIDISSGGGLSAETINNSGTIILSGGGLAPLSYPNIVGNRGAINNSGTITLSGGTLGNWNPNSNSSISNDGTISGFGTVNGPVSGTGTITASNGVLNLTGAGPPGNSVLTIDQVLTIDPTVASTLEFSGTVRATAPIAINSSNQTLLVSGFLSIGGVESITNGQLSVAERCGCRRTAET